MRLCSCTAGQAQVGSSTEASFTIRPASVENKLACVGSSKSSELKKLGSEGAREGEQRERGRERADGKFHKTGKASYEIGHKSAVIIRDAGRLSIQSPEFFHELQMRRTHIRSGSAAGQRAQVS